MSDFTLGDIDPLIVTSWSGFDYPARVTVQPILAADQLTPGNARLQSSALTVQQGSIGGTLLDDADLATLRGYNASTELVTFTDDAGNGVAVHVIDLQINRLNLGPERWSYSAKLVVAP